MTLKETLKEMNRLTSDCSARNSIYTLFMVHCLSLVFRYGYTYAPNPCFESMHETTETTETSNANMRYPKSLTPSPTVAMMLPYSMRNRSTGSDTLRQIAEQDWCIYVLQQDFLLHNLKKTNAEFPNRLQTRLIPFQIRSKLQSDLRRRYNNVCCYGLADWSLLAYPGFKALKQIGVRQYLL